mmetsp:Transcript_43646/g.102639  ORF Transcript_43646/g.102639 Transcript_43646/m.102639 type:complete len:202 (+) Transcript_43646:30-635(+)
MCGSLRPLQFASLVMCLVIFCFFVSSFATNFWVQEKDGDAVTGFGILPFWQVSYSNSYIKYKVICNYQNGWVVSSSCSGNGCDSAKKLAEDNCHKLNLKQICSANASGDKHFQGYQNLLCKVREGSLGMVVFGSILSLAALCIQGILLCRSWPKWTVFGMVALLALAWVLCIITLFYYGVEVAGKLDTSTFKTGYSYWFIL